MSNNDKINERLSIHFALKGSNCILSFFVKPRNEKKHSKKKNKDVFPSNHCLLRHGEICVNHAIATTTKIGVPRDYAMFENAIKNYSEKINDHWKTEDMQVVFTSITEEK